MIALISLLVVYSTTLPPLGNTISHTTPYFHIVMNVVKIHVQ